MANNPVKGASRNSKEQFQTYDNDTVNWNNENKMATKFYNINKFPLKDAQTSGKNAYGNSDLDMLSGSKDDKE